MSETTAKEIMTRDLVRATDGMTIEEALKVLINHRVTGLPVVDENGKMTGVISEYDILSQISKSKKNRGEVFQDLIVYSRKVDAISEDTPLSKIVNEFLDTKFRRLPVVDKDGSLVGIITRRDLMKVYYYRSRLAD
ncbi:MAG: CBS domain-containing protein [Cryobacterium sp.]|nr:CBS domain-containing protein [Oligoflexia bacterium]